MIYLYSVLKMFLFYLLFGLLALVFLFYYYLEKGWIGYYVGFEWVLSFVWVGFGGLFKNGLVLGWWLADYGMVFSWVALGLVIW